MPRARQLSLELKPPRNRKGTGHGGWRPGAGRPKKSEFLSHVAREAFSGREPLHVTFRIRAGLPNLRRKDVFRGFRHALRAARSQGLRVVHFAILSNHAHLIVESAGKESLGRQMQSMGISFSKAVNRAAGRKGSVLRERYHVHALRTPRETKNALAYVLTNEFKHEGGRGRVDLDEFSSALGVADGTWAKLLGAGWRRLLGVPPWDDPDTVVCAGRALDELVFEPRTWLLRSGWQRA